MSRRHGYLLTRIGGDWEVPFSLHTVARLGTYMYVQKRQLARPALIDGTSKKILLSNWCSSFWASFFFFSHPKRYIYIFFHLNELSITTSDIDQWWHCSCPLNPVFTMHACEFKLQMNYISWRESEICCCLRPTSPCVSHSFHRGFTEPQCWPADQFMNLFHSVDCLEEWKWLFFKMFFLFKNILK